MQITHNCETSWMTQSRKDSIFEFATWISQAIQTEKEGKLKNIQVENSSTCDYQMYTTKTKDLKTEIDVSQL